MVEATAATDSPSHLSVLMNLVPTELIFALFWRWEG